jgi:CRISPR-associated protein Cmr3
MRLFIEPTEPLLFRTARPFDAGENNLAESIFPPTPETLQGTIRAALATHWNTAKTLEENFADPALTDLIGDRNGYGRFRLTNITLARRKRDEAQSGNGTGAIEYLYPMPSIILLEEENVEHQARLIPRPRPPAIHTNLSDEKYLLYQNHELEGKPTTRKYWLTRRGLWKALLTEEDIATEDMVSASTIYTTEPRLGIGMNNATKTTKEGFLYQVHMIRMNHLMDHDYTYGFVVDIRIAQKASGAATTQEPLIDDRQTQEMLRLDNDGWLTLGGERRAARFEVIKSPEAEEQAGSGLSAKGNMLYLLTPAAFDRGWQPASWAKWAEPVAVAMERYQSIGGWLLNPENAGGRNKPQRRCVPAGSVYFFKETVTASIPFTDYGKEIGYGIAFAGEWKQ